MKSRWFITLTLALGLSPAFASTPTPSITLNAPSPVRMLSVAEATRQYSPQPDLFSNRGPDAYYSCDVSMWYTTLVQAQPHQWLDAASSEAFVVGVNAKQGWKTAHSWTLRKISGYRGYNRWCAFQASYLLVAFNAGHCGGDLLFSEKFHQIGRYEYNGATFVLGYQQNVRGGYNFPVNLVDGLAVQHP